MELLYVGLVAAIAALNLIGGGVLIRWLVKQIRTLEGTVSAQGNTITAQGEALRAADQTYRSLNDLMNVLDLERWVKRFESHAKLVEAEGQAKSKQNAASFRSSWKLRRPKASMPRLGRRPLMATRHWPWQVYPMCLGAREWP